MKLLARHSILVSGKHYEDCRAQIDSFLENTTLVQYDKVSIDDDAVVNGDNDQFPERLKKGIERNQAVLAKFIDELETAGFEKRSDLPSLKQGYPSKLLHIIAHFLDGFIGIDTAFYNLIDDSHWIPSKTAEQLARHPEKFWLIPLDCYSMTPREAALLHM